MDVRLFLPLLLLVAHTAHGQTQTLRGEYPPELKFSLTKEHGQVVVACADEVRKKYPGNGVSQLTESRRCTMSKSPEWYRTIERECRSGILRQCLSLAGDFLIVENERKGRELLSFACKKGHHQSCMTLQREWFNSCKKGIRKDCTSIQSLLERECRSGDKAACHDHKQALTVGCRSGFPADCKRAGLNRACEKGSRLSCIWLYQSMDIRCKSGKAKTCERLRAFKAKHNINL